MTAIRLATLASALLMVDAPPVAAAEAFGLWSTEGGKAKVRISRCGEALCGVIFSLKDPLDPDTGRPKTDARNADAGKRGRPIVGVAILLGMKPAAVAGKWEGQVYNAEDGKTYSGSIMLTGAHSLEVQGCALGGLICRSQIWRRAQ